MLPRYRDLPTHRTPPDHAAWATFGPEDEAGTVNLLTPEALRRAATLVVSGHVFPLNWDAALPDPPLSGSAPGSQWRALGATRHPAHGGWNGHANGSRNGVEQWARRGIAGRFVLADVARYRAAFAEPIRPDAADAITTAEIEATLRYQSVTLESGDILLVRTGWIAWYESLDDAAREALAKAGAELHAPGLAGDEETAAWLWDQRIAAVATDAPAVAALPDHEGLQARCAALLGLATGALFALDALAEDCARDQHAVGLFTAAPLNAAGAATSPANALAIK